MKKLLLTCALASAFMLTAGAYDYTGDKTEWMKHIPGTTFASQVTIPGSHDSATGEGWTTLASMAGAATYSQTQNVKIDAQLAAGLRGFDIRPYYYGREWVCSHGIHTTTLSLEDCFGKFTTFLTEHPSEFIVIHLYHGGSGWTSSDMQRLPTFLANYSDYLVNFRRDLTVDDLRGKILIFSREEYDGSTYGAKLGSLRNYFGWGSWVDWERATNIIARGNIVSPLNEGRLFYQDLAGFNDIEEKKAEIKKLLDVTTSYQANSGETCIWFFNFGSGYTGSTSTSASYKSTATACNPEYISYLESKPGPAGIVLADYVCVEETQGTALIDALINNNFNYLTYVEDGVGAPTVFNPSTSAGTASSWTLGQGSTNFRATQRSASIIGDFNGDGMLDIMQSGSNDHAHLYLNGDWKTVELQNQEQGIPQNTFPRFCTLDFNNDGLLDVIITGVSDHPDNYKYRGIPYAQMSTGNYYAMTCLFQNMGNNTFKTVSNSGLPVMVGTRYGEEYLGYTALPTVFGAGDFDHDGYTDVVVCGKKVENGSESEHAAVYRNNGDGTFIKVKDLDPVIGYVHVADMNNDGWLDIVLTGYYNGSNGRVYLNNNGTSWTDATNYTIPGYWTRNNGSALGDFNKDGYLDLFTVGYSDQAGFATLLNYNNHGTSGDIFTAPYVFNDHGLPWDWAEALRVAVRDFNNDGNLDILYDMKEDSGIWYGSESMKFTREGYDTNIGARGGGIDDSASSFGDLNGDGLTDRHQTGYMWIDGNIGPQRHNGWEGGWNWESSYYVNTNSTASVKAPAAPTNVFITRNGNELNITWKDLDDKTLAYNVVFYNATDGKVISTLPVSIIKTDDTTDVKIAIGEGKEAAVRPGVESYTVTLPAAGETEFAAGVQALSLYNETVSPIAWAQIPLPPLTLLGDANDNGNVTVADVVTTANYVAGKDVDNFHFNNANVVLAEEGEEEEITAADITAIVNIVLESSKGKMGMKRHAAVVATEDRLVSDNFKVRGNEPITIDVKLENTADYAALQADIKLPEGMQLQDVVKGARASNHSMVYNVNADGILKVVIYSLSNEAFLNAEGSLFSLVVKAREDCNDIIIDGIRASDASSNTYNLGFKGGYNLTDTTGIPTISDAAEAQYFTLQGVRVDRPERGGIYIRIIDGKSSKVVIR